MELTPAQSEVLAQLGAAKDQRPVFDAELRHQIRAELEHSLAPIAEHLGDRDLFVSKHALSSVLGCERRHVAEEAEPFAWTSAIAVGTVAHRAIELRLAWRGDPPPAELVDEALARTGEEDTSLGDWLRTLGEADRAELAGLATERVTVFEDTFPPLRRDWRPTAESRLRVEIADGRIIFSGKIDLTLGRADGTTAGKVLIDLKTGARRHQHLDDLRFYALLETVRVGTPPRLVATHYLDQGVAVTEAVTVGVLRAALARTIEGTARLAELASHEREPAVAVGPGCRWCPVSDSCDAGTAWLADQDR